MSVVRYFSLIHGRSVTMYCFGLYELLLFGYFSSAISSSCFHSEKNRGRKYVLMISRLFSPCKIKSIAEKMETKLHAAILTKFCLN